MKTFIFILSFITCVGMYNSCRPKAEKVDAEKAKLEAAEHDFDNDYEAFSSQRKNQLKEHESLLDQLKLENKKRRGEERTIHDKTISDLEKKNQEMKTKLKKYTYKGTNDWKVFKTEFTSTLDSLGFVLRGMNKPD